MSSITTYIIKNKKTWIGILLGSIAGFFYWQQIGCISGTCAITSNPVNSTVYGAILGGLLLNSFETKPKKENE